MTYSAGVEEPGVLGERDRYCILVDDVNRPFSRSLVALFAAPVVVFAWSVPAYLEVWKDQPYTHGYLVGLASLWLAWRVRAALRHPGPSATWALFATATLSVLWLVGMVADARIVVLTVAPLLLLGWCAVVFGSRAAARLGPAVAFFMLAVPVWGVLSRPLQLLTIAVSGAVLDVARIPAEIDGDTVHIAFGSFLVENGCSGLNYLMSGLTVGALYALVLTRTWSSRAAVLGLASSLPIVGNWIRVSSLIVIGHVTRMESPVISEPIPHLAYGWLIFASVLLVFFPLAGRVASSEAHQRAISRVTATAPKDMTSPPPVGAWPSHRAAFAATAAVVMGPLIYAVVGALPTREVTPAQLTTPSGAWQASRSTGRPFDWAPAFTGADEHRAVTWTRERDIVLVDHLVYHDQEQGAELVGFTSRIAPDSLITGKRLFGPIGPERLLVNEVIVFDQGAPLLIWYWYRVGGVRVAQDFRAKLLELWAFFSRARTSELIAVSAPCERESCLHASEVLSDFMDHHRAEEPSGAAGR